ncbi:MAG: hypothetical protein EOP53_20640 [Sphingobacteriales bacterium]|nr:MAG: hypothetical protein EOP53_20640 [Sphingobacteriales bacterium]
MPGFELPMLPQPNDETCGATCLHALYRYYGEEQDLGALIEEVQTLDTGGTLAVILGIHALKKGYDAHIYTYNLHVFDPTWFRDDVNILEKLRQQAAIKENPKLQWATKAYLEFLELGGELHYEELDEHLLRTFFDRKVPLLTGLNATYLYGTPREFGNEYDDIRGTSSGHFVVLYGYDKITQQVLIADPLLSNPISGSNQYSVTIDKLINSIMLGIVTYDANFLVIEKGDKWL